MINKKVLVCGSLDSLQEFLNSPFNRTYEVAAILTEEKARIDAIRTGGGIEIEILQPENLPKFIYKFVDGVILTDRKNFPAQLNYFVSKGLEPRKIILWNNQGTPEIFTLRDKDGVDVAFMEGLQFHIRKQEDFNFVNQIRGQLASQKRFYALQPSQYKQAIEFQYRQATGQIMDLDNPKNFTEKLQWLKLYDSTPIKTRLADKYLVRQWVAEKIGEQYLIPLLGVWDNFDDIDFDLLPNQFVLKTNHASGTNIIVRDKKTFDKENAREKINAWLEIDYGVLFYELHYNNLKKKIIAEKFLTDGKNLDLIDYKFMCFNGKPFICQYLSERSIELTLDYFDLNWKHLDIERSDHPNSKHPEKISKPKNFELMKKLAAKLCKDFAFVRVDFYEVADKIYFGEMTFVPAAGNISFKPVGSNEGLGNLLTLPAPSEFKQLSR